MAKNVCHPCADKIVDFHQFYTMYLESDLKLRQLLAVDGVHTEIKEESSPIGSPVESLYIEPATENDVASLSDRPDERKHVEEIFVEVTQIDDNLKFECEMCQAQFKSKRSLTKHVHKCVEPTTSAKLDENDDMSLESGAYTIKMEASTRIDESDDEPVEQRQRKTSFQCANCSADFTANEPLHEHEAACTASSSATLSRADKGSKAKNPDANGNWICEKCAEAFPSKIALREHRKTHREPKKYTENETTGKYVCDVCNKSFDSKEKIQFHVRRHGDIKCLCNVCGKWLSCRDNLNKHYRAVHLNEKKHVCPMCGHRFTSSFRLKDHVNSHKGIRAYSCNLCPTRFYNCSAVKRHMDTVHSDEKKYVCNVCSKAFKLPTNLKTHMFAHTGVFEHPCGQCGKGFRRKNKMMQHIKEMHGVAPS